MCVAFAIRLKLLQWNSFGGENKLTKKPSPTTGDKIPTAKFHISKLNVRADEPFGETEEDKALTHQLYKGKIIAPFKARPEGDGYGVYVGRRRFLAKKQAGTKEFIVGRDVLIDDVDEEEAREQSLIENVEILREEMNPMLRAKALSELVATSPSGLRGVARRLGISHSSLSEWIKPMELSPPLQKALEKGDIYFTDAVRLARMELPNTTQQRLAETLEKEGLEAFQDAVERVGERKLKRGIPKGVYEVDRVVWDKRNQKEMSYYETLRKVAEVKEMKVPEYIKDFVIRHIDEIKRELR